ncbi:MAG: RNA polymerase sigma factor [Gammaproteobacteria bacterium]|nr:RNA polymerase sigma factor [Gammaproteobacteria bacterium]MDH3559564.1 RNA polymerase sigma factor [Gammaproteobacteria bacterium]
MSGETTQTQEDTSHPRQALYELRDDQLVRLVQQRGLGWKLARDVLFGRHRCGVVTHCMSRLGHYQDAQDVTQRVLLRALAALGRFEGRSAFRTWLYAITENECRTFLVQRARYVQTEHIERLVELFETGAANELDTLMVQDAVAIALAQVSPLARQVLRLRFFEDRTLEEIAAVLAISLSAAKMRLYRALDQFNLSYQAQVQPA